MTKEEFKNLSVGSTFQLGNVKLRVEEFNKKGIQCKTCVLWKGGDYFCWTLRNFNFIPECGKKNREDKKDVYFVDVENIDNKEI